MKNKYFAAAFAFLGGGLWLQKFYLWKWFQWILCIVFSITFIPLIIWFIEWIIFLLHSQEWFDIKFNAEYIKNEAEIEEIKEKRNSMNNKKRTKEIK